MNFLIAHADGTEQPSPEVTPRMVGLKDGGILVLLDQRSLDQCRLVSGTVIGAAIPNVWFEAIFTVRTDIPGSSLKGLNIHSHKRVTLWIVDNCLKDCNSVENRMVFQDEDELLNIR